MVLSPVPLRASEMLIGVSILVASVIAAVATAHWTVLIVPIAWAAIAALSTISLPQRFCALAAATVLLPRYPLEVGFSVDDFVPSAAAICGILLLVRWKLPRMPRVIEAAFGVWLVAAAASAMFNGHGLSGFIRLAAPGIGRPLLWLIFVWTAYALAQRGGIRLLLIPVAVVAIIQSVFVIATYSGCTEIHIGAVAEPQNRAVWEARRGLGVEQGAGTNVGEQRIRCRATGTIGQSANFLAAFLVTAVPVIAGAALHAKGRTRWIYAGGGVLAFAGLLLTFTRAALPAAALALFVMLAFAAPRRVLPTIVIISVLLAILVGAIPQVRKRLTDERADRLALWYSGALIFKDNPVLGVGFGNYRKVQLSNPRYLHTPYGEPTSTAHNGFIGIAAEGGVLQLGAVLVLAIAILIAGARAAARSRGTPNAPLIAAAFGGACGFLAQNMTNTLLLVPAVATYFWLFGGLLLGASAIPFRAAGAAGEADLAFASDLP
ncbi:MAG: hypothetical protein NVSMB57_01160 [Actinomycetota bacterium]